MAEIAPNATAKESSTAPGVSPELIVGLGNPGAKYDKTRHNIGFDVVDRLAQGWQIPLSEHRKFHGVYGEGVAAGGKKLRLLKPTTFMNRSGQSVRAIADWFKLDPAQILVIYDDMDLPLGRIRLRLTGSAGGHNGMKSIISHLGTQDFPRLRIGIGAPRQAGADQAVVSHVLGTFAPHEQPIRQDVELLARDCVEYALRHDPAKAMSLFNSRTVEPS